MKVLVCISSVPDTTAKINFAADNSSFDKDGIQWIINPLDEFALIKAIKLREKNFFTVTVINIGDVTTEPILRKALAIGADDAIRVNIEPRDSFSTAREISKISQEGDYDLIITGKESIDYNGGAVPGMIAQLLDRPYVNACVGIEIKEEEAIVVRETEARKETISIKLPAVISVQKGIIEEKDIIVPNMRGIMSARTKPLKVVEASFTGVKVEPISFESVLERGPIKFVSPDNLDELVRLLHEEAKVI